MVRNFSKQSGSQISSANEERFTTAGDMLEPTLSDVNRYFPVFSVESTNTQWYAPGVGYQNEAYAQGWSDFDFQNTASVAIQGKGRWALYTDSTLEEPIAYSTTYSLGNLRSSVAENRTDKLLLYGMQPGGQDDRVLVFELSPNAASEGDTVSQLDSTEDLGLPYSLFR